MFRFKQFTIRQDRCPMKVGTDGVLLGAWAGVRSGDRRVLDIGTGTGLIALILAQRTDKAQIIGIDIDDVSQACENAAVSPWAARLRFAQCPAQEFVAEERFDLIVSNPPYFVDSLTCPDAGRTTARHAVRLTYEQLRDAVARLLAPGGRFAVILPTAEAELFCAVCADHLHLCRRTDVRTTPRHAPKRVLMEFAPATPAAVASALAPSAPATGTPSVAPPEIACLTVGTGEHEQYTSEYRALTRDFYLKF